MIQLAQIRNFFPPFLRDDPANQKYLLKEYLLLTILDYLSTTKYVQKLILIGGTNLRLIKGIDRFSEDLDFDCRDLSFDEFMEMTDHVIRFLQRSGWHIEPKDKPNPKLNAFRRNLHFPELLFDLGLSGHKEERFLLKLEAEDQHLEYTPKLVKIKGCGYFFSFPVPDDSVLTSMKLSALFSRHKGRDFYDTMFLLSQTAPDYKILTTRYGIRNMSELKDALLNLTSNTNLKHKSRDFEHLLFVKDNSKRILNFREFVEVWKHH